MITGADEAVEPDPGQRLRTLARDTAQHLLDAAPDTLAAVADRFLAQLPEVLAAGPVGHTLFAVAAAAAEQAHDRLAITPLTEADVQAAVSELLVCSSTLTPVGRGGDVTVDPCDFCSREVMKWPPRWIYPVRGNQLAGLAPAQIADAALEIGWRACEDCASLVEDGDFDALSVLMGGIGGVLPRALRMFRDNRAGDAVRIQRQ